MSDSAERTPLARRHEHLVALLGAYADDELPPEVRHELEIHLEECAQCIQELQVQSALKHRLRAEAYVLESSESLSLLKAHVDRLTREAPEQLPSSATRRHQSLGAPAPRDLERLADCGERRGPVGPGSLAPGRPGHGGDDHGPPGPGLGRQRPRTHRPRGAARFPTSHPARHCRRDRSWHRSSPRCPSRFPPSPLRTCG